MISGSLLLCTDSVLTSRTDVAEEVAGRGHFSFLQGVVDGATLHVSGRNGDESPIEAL
jgi:hypothetical protein